MALLMCWSDSCARRSSGRPLKQELQPGRLVTGVFRLREVARI